MKRIFKFFAKRHLLANLLTIMILMIGISTLLTINKDLFPRVTLNQVIITTVYPGASPEDVEFNVTNMIERELQTVNDLERISSVSAREMSIISITISDDLGNDRVTQVVQDIRDAVAGVGDLPAEVDGRPQIERIDGSYLPIIGIGIAGERVGYRELREYAKILETKLKEVDGVAKVDKTGYRNREVRIEIDPEKMEYYNLTIGEVISAISNKNVNETVGIIKSSGGEKNVQINTIYSDPGEVADVIVRSTFNGAVIRVKDVAVIKDTFRDKFVIPRINGKDVIYFSVQKKEKKDIVKTVAAVKALIEDEKEHIPEGMEILYTNDLSRYVKASFDVVWKNLIMGFALVVIILTIFMSFRVSFWVAMGIPISLLGSIALFPLFNVSLDVITMTAMILILGMIVDDAIVIAERIYHHHENGCSPVEASVKGLQDIFWPVVTTVLSTLLAFVPMFLIPGDMGKFIRVIPLTITLALTISLLEGVVALPAHLSMGFEKSGKKQKAVKQEKGLFLKIKHGYRKMLVGLLRFRYVIIGFFIITLAGCIYYAVTQMEINLFPNDGAEEFAVHLEAETGTPLDEMAVLVNKIEAVVETLPETELASYMTIIGNQEGFFVRPNIATIRLNLTPFSKRDRDATAIAAELSKGLEGVDGFTRIAVDIADSGPNPEKPVSLTVVGEDDAVRMRLMHDIIAYMEEMDGVANITYDNEKGLNRVLVALDHTKLTRLRLNETDISHNLRIIYNGMTVTNAQYGQDHVRFRVVYPEKYKRNAKQLLGLTIPNAEGRLIHFHQFANTVMHEGIANYYHVDGLRSFTIEAGVDADSINAQEVTDRIVKEFGNTNKYPGMRIIVGGTAKRNKESMRNIGKAYLIAIIGIYFLLVLLFNSLKQPFIVIAIVPFGIYGVIITFALHGLPISFMALLGVVGLSGVVVNDSLVMVEYLNTIIRENPDKPLFELVALGAADRLRAILLTTITTAAGLLPLAYGIGGSDPSTAPMVLAMGWGLIFGTALTLILIPCFYVVANDLGRRSKRAAVVE